MSTAGRATFTPAIARPLKTGGQQSQQIAARNLNSHTKLKFRQPGQGTKAEVQKKDLRQELEDKERKGKPQKEESSDSEDEQPEPKLLEAGEENAAPVEKNIDADDSDSGSSSDSDSESDKSEDEEDEDQQLLRELEKIKRERAEEAARREMENIAEKTAEREEQIMQGNPLINTRSTEPADFSIKKRWYDDSVFKNQTRTEVAKRFINDTIRNDFHKKFLYKYIQ
ncbi:putative Pre-mRNA-splicing factor cwc15 [Planoprotostelium fungivorum]|uniref:Putative Pre-mRNA-splicing factor cwc15 n=1 Tax=Planoprotostelium fungivorum TaxID=1890364 RepID=A0A2P6NK14_9EUKA|nr:putative Pre-mRNA-splicing factor cwc15 [Planoprotostelium fungivorum]